MNRELLIGFLGIIAGALVVFVIFNLRDMKHKESIHAALFLSMLGVALTKVDLADSRTIQSTFDGLTTIGYATLGIKSTNNIIDTVADEIGNFMEVEIDGEDDSKH